METPTQPNGRFTFHLCSDSKLASPVIFTFHQGKSFKKLWKVLFVSPKLLFWLLEYSDLRRKLGKRKKSYDLIYETIQKLLQIKGSTMIRWWTTNKKKILNIFGNALKAVPVTFRDFGQKQKNKFRVSKDFW